MTWSHGATCVCQCPDLLRDYILVPPESPEPGIGCAVRIAQVAVSM